MIRGAEGSAKSCSRAGGGYGRQNNAGCETCAREAIALPRFLIRSEEEQLVFPHRATEAESELVLLQHRFWKSGSLHKKVVRVEDVVANELEQCTVECARS